MLAVIFAFSYAIVIFTLAAEASSDWLRITGLVFAGWMAVAGAYAGYQHFRE